MTQTMSFVVPRLRSWNTERKFSYVISARTSHDGRFVAIKVEKNVLVVVHNKLFTEDLLLSETKDFVWGVCNWHTSRSLDPPVSNQYLYALDQELNIIIFEVGANENTFNHSIITLIGSSILLTVQEIQEVEDVTLISACFNNSGQNHFVNCLVNQKYFVQLNISKTKEPAVTHFVVICEESAFGSNGISKYVQRDGCVYFLSDHLVLSILSQDSFQVILKVNLQESLLVYEIQQFDVTSNVADGSVAIVLLDDTLQLHFLRLEEFQLTSTSAAVASQTTDKKWPNVWNYRLSRINTGQRRLRSLKKNASSPLCTVPPEAWMNDHSYLDMSVSGNTILLLLEPKVKGSEESQQHLLAYNIQKNIFESVELEVQSCLCLCINPAFPNLLVSTTMITIPTFGTNQEQLIDTIIQFSGISQAELICKGNGWDQLSIPLHTLEVGLQHRQIETVAFFLKSREKVFTRFWKGRNDLSSSMNSTGSPSKSFSSQRSYSEAVNSDEMFSAIEMLLKAASSCSKGKHKQAFFESLLTLTISYLNHLIQDGVAALQMESYTITNEGRQPRSASVNSIGNHTFNFIQNIPESMKFITHNLLELRQYVPFKKITSQDTDQVDGVAFKSASSSALSDKLEDMLLSGNIATLQKMLFTRSGVCSGTFESLVDYGLQVVEKYLKVNDTEQVETILLNLGLDHKVEIKRIYTTTFERKLRNTLFPYLKKQQLLTQEDIVDLNYLEELEEIYQSEDFTLVLKSHSYNWNSESSQTESNLKSVVGYSNLCLQHVSQLDEETRRHIIVEGKFISSAIETIKAEDGPHFWKFLLKHNEVPTLLKWLTTKCDSQTLNEIKVFESLPETLVAIDEFVPSYTKEILVNTLVKYGYYPGFLLKDIPLFVKYLTQTGRLFGDEHPIVFFKQQLPADERERLVNEFNVYFVRFCERNDLALLLWKFLTHYKLDSSDMKLEGNVKSWLPFILNFHNLFTSKDTDTNTLFQTFASNASYLTTPSVDQNFIGLNEMVSRNQAIVALSIALVCNKSIEEIREESPELKTPFSIEKELLKNTLQAYPKVYDALRADSSESLENKDVSMYRLLQDNTQLEIRYWFGWQKDNTLAVNEENTLADLPHFANTFLSERYALDVKLSFDYYLGQARPMYAYLVFMKNNNKATISESSKDRACSIASKLAIQNFNSPPIAASCILFVELLEGQHKSLKVDVIAANLISKFWNKRATMVTHEKKFTADEVNAMLVDLLLCKRSSDDLVTVLKYLEDCTEVAIYENKEIERFSYEAVCHWQLVVRFSRLHCLPLTTCYIKACCKADNWLQLFLFIHLYQVPPEQVLSVIEEVLTNNSLKEHLVAVVKKTKEIAVGKKMTEKKQKSSREDALAKTVEVEAPANVKKNYRAQFYSKLGTAMPSKEGKQSDSLERKQQQPLTSTPKKEDLKDDTSLAETSATEMYLMEETRFPDIDEIPDSLVDLLLECDEHKAPWKKLLGYAVASFNPLLCVLAACYEDAVHSECLCIWLVCSVDDHLKSKICENLLDIADQDAILMLRNHRWSEEDLLIIVKCLLVEGVKYTKLICQGFIIFRKADPLLHLTQFIEAFLYDREKTVVLSLLAEFQTEYQAYRNRHVMGKTFTTEDDLYLCEDFSLQCVLLLLEQCSTTYHAYKLLGYLADSKFGYMFDRHVPNFMLAKQTAEIIYSTGISFSVQRLCTTSIEDMDQEVHTLYTKLLDSGAFEEAYTFAQLHNLPESDITARKVSHELDQMCLKPEWQNLELRCSFWNQADRTFNELSCSPELAVQFFEEQAVAEDDTKTYEERTALLLLTIRWYKCCRHIDSKKLSRLEKKVWLFKINGVKVIQQTGILSPTIKLDGSKSDSFFSLRGHIERKCSDVSYIQNLPVTELLQNEDMDYLFESERAEDGEEEFTLKDLQDQQAFEWLVGNLLDELHVTEARKVASYFQKTTTDLEIIMTAIRLAQGQIAVERCSDTIKAILAGTTSRHISVSGILERSGSFTRPESLSQHTRMSGASDVMVDFVFIEEVQNALEKLTIRINHGKKCCQQILICFKVANILSIPYEEVVNDGCMSVLKKMLEAKFEHQRQLAKQFIKAFDISVDEVATFIADLVLSWVGLITGEAEMIIEASTTVSSEEEMKPPNNEDILGLIQLAENSSLVGTMILEEAANISNEVVSSSKVAKLTYQVELLVYAHYCFTITCDMEGIAGVLRITHHCTKCLAKRNQYSLMVRLLTGIGRFREMFYVIETLYNQHHFEVLCRKGKGNERENQLKMALLDFMRRYHPEDVENLNMISVGFGMYREAAQHLEKQGLAEIERIKHDLKGGGSKDIMNTLEEIQKTFSYAANNYSKEECLYPEQSCTRLAHLAKLQIQLLPSGVQVLGLTKLQVQEFLNTHTDFIESLIVADCYDFREPVTWTEPLYRMVILKGHFSYLDQFQNFFQLTPTIVTNVAKRFRSDRNSQSPSNMKKFLHRLRDVRAKIKIARELNFTDIEKQLLEGPSGVYIRDHIF